MRNFSLLSLLLAVAIVGWMAKSMFAPAVSHDPNDKSTVEYWVAHSQDRAAMLAWCQQNSQQQDSGECQLATAAQLQIDTQRQSAGDQSSGNGKPGQGPNVSDASGNNPTFDSGTGQ